MVMCPKPRSTSRRRNDASPTVTWLWIRLKPLSHKTLRACWYAVYTKSIKTGLSTNNVIDVLYVNMDFNKLHGYNVHQQYWTLFYYQLMHITLKNAELLKHSKLDKNAPTCFGLHRNHLQGAKVSAWLKITRLVNSICVKDVQGVVSAMAAYCDL